MLRGVALARFIAVSPALDITYLWRPDTRAQEVLGCIQADLRVVTTRAFDLN